MNYYELLEIAPDASNMDIINAYRQAKLAFRPESLAAYSLFDEAEIERLRQQIETAYETLSNKEKRMAYDAALGLGGSTPAKHAAAATKASARVVEMDRAAPAGIRFRIAVATEFPGAFLREIREYRGISLEAIAEHTKISRGYLQAIEDENEDRLPEPAYLKGYLRQYAAEIGLDAERVLAHYPPLQRLAADS